MKYTKEFIDNLEIKCEEANFAPFDLRFPKNVGDSFEWDDYSFNLNRYLFL